ncbi:MAG TPA: 30S ribosomal protein S5 [Armatimonadota bacterium]|jgi:small subunit ribosomal protein S5
MARIDISALELGERVVSLNRVQKVHKGGRTLRWSALVVVGDGKGYVGVGMGKASEVPEAIRKGAEAAKKALMRVAIIEGSIPHAVEKEVGAARVLLKPAAPGTGVIAGGAVRAIVESAGVRDILTKSLGSANAVNIAWATVECLKSLRTFEEVAAIRGKTVEEIRGPRAQKGEVA